jgi:DNA repair exonuclease SbcCD nuclease subunit
VLCAGDLFDSPNPSKNWWQGLADKFNRLAWTDRPVFLLPGNHDPLTATSVYSQDHGFRKALPPWVHVIEDDNQEIQLSDEAVLYASPCRSQSGQSDLAMALPARHDGDTRIRIGMVHGSTFDMEGYQMNFPISRTAAVDRGLDYLAIGDTHAFRHVPPDANVPTVYPSAPEPTNFGETEAGYAAVVFVKRLGRKPMVRKEPVAQWTWQDRTCGSLPELEQLLHEDLANHVVRLSLEMSLPAHEYDRAEQILRGLQGTDAVHGKVGILQVDRSGLDLDVTDVETAFENAPDVLRRAAERLRNTTGEAAPAAKRALYHLYRLSRDGAR